MNGKPKNTADPYAVVVTSDSSTVVGHEEQRVTCFQVAEHGYLTGRTNGITKLTTPTIYIDGFLFGGLLPKPANPPNSNPTGISGYTVVLTLVVACSSLPNTVTTVDPCLSELLWPKATKYSFG